MKNNKVLNDRELHNRGIDSKDCKNCVYNLENGCPSDRTYCCWSCKFKSNFSPLKNHSFSDFSSNYYISYLSNFDFLSQHLSENHFNSFKFSAIGFDFDDDNNIRQVQLMDGFDFFEVLREVYLNEKKYGVHFCILHHDSFGFHFLVF